MNRMLLWIMCMLFLSTQTILSFDQHPIHVRAYPSSQSHAHVHTYFHNNFSQSYFASVAQQAIIAQWMQLAQKYGELQSQEYTAVQEQNVFDSVGFEVVKTAQEIAQTKQEHLTNKQKQVQEKLKNTYPWMCPKDIEIFVPDSENACNGLLKKLPADQIQKIFLAQQADHASLKTFFKEQDARIEIVSTPIKELQTSHDAVMQITSASTYQTRRSEAYYKTIENQFTLHSQAYCLSQEVKNMLTSQAIDIDIFTHLESTDLGHELFSELHTETHIAALVQKDKEQLFTVLYAQSGAQACQSGELESAAHFIDLLHAFNSYALAAGKGVALGIKDVIEGYNPVTMAQAVTHIAQGTGWLIEQTSELITNYFQDYDEFSLQIDRAYNTADLLFQHLVHYISSTAGPQLLEDGIRTVVSMTNLHKSIINAGLLTLEKAALAGGRYVNQSGKMINFAREIETCADFEQLAAIQKQATPIQEFYGGSIKFRTVQKVNAAHDAQKSVPAFRKKEVIQEIQKRTQKLCLQEKIGYEALIKEGQKLNALLSKDIKASREYKNLGDLYKQYKNIKCANLPVELQQLSKEHPGKFMIDLEHIFAAEIVKTKNRNTMSVTGFHHDPNYFMQKLDSVLHFPQESIEQLGDGFYNAQIIIDSHIPSSKQVKTFFPAHWTREEVMECVVSRLKNAEELVDRSRKDNITKMIIERAFISSYNENIDIVYIYDVIKNKLKTVYPIQKMKK